MEPSSSPFFRYSSALQWSLRARWSMLTSMDWLTCVSTPDRSFGAVCGVARGLTECSSSSPSSSLSSSVESVSLLDGGAATGEAKDGVLCGRNGPYDATTRLEARLYSDRIALCWLRGIAGNRNSKLPGITSVKKLCTCTKYLFPTRATFSTLLDSTAPSLVDTSILCSFKPNFLSLMSSNSCWFFILFFLSRFSTTSCDSIKSILYYLY